MSYTVLFNIEQESYPYAYPVVYLRVGLRYRMAVYTDLKNRLEICYNA